MRLKIFRVITGMLFTIVGVGLFHLQIIQGEHYRRLSQTNRIRIIPLPAPRGRILDRDGRVLAQNRLVYHVALIPQDIRDAEALFEFVARVLKANKKELQQLFFQRKTAPFAPVIIAEDIPKETAMRIEENRFRFPGLYIQQGFVREYMLGPMTAHILGYLSRSRPVSEALNEYGYVPWQMAGVGGVEQRYDAVLKGRPGGLQIEVDHRGRQRRILGMRFPEQGRDIRLTLDARIQQIAYEALGERPGTIIVANPVSGEILALVSYPAYKPNLLSGFRIPKEAVRWFNDPDAPLLNRAIQGLYPPGSTVKPIWAAAGLDQGVITPQSVFHCSGGLKRGGRWFSCAHVHGDENLTQAIAHSCNVYFFRLGEALGIKAMERYALMFGLGKKTGIDLPFEEAGHVPQPFDRRGRQWFGGDTLNTAIGQGEFLVTPLQLVRMMAVFATKGRSPGMHVHQKAAKNQIESHNNVVLSDRVWETVRTGLRLTVSAADGTAHALDLYGFRVSGKTGTAQAGGRKPHHAWFVGFDVSGRLPIVFCVFLEHGGSSANAVHRAGVLLQRLRAQDLI